MYKPWKPLDRLFTPHPYLEWQVHDRTLMLTWSEWFDNECRFRMEVRFENGLAGLFCFDESVYQTAEDALGVPAETELDWKNFSPIPWPAWISEPNYRKHLYGDLGELFYDIVYSYYIVGSETVLLFDIADSEPVVNVIDT